MLVSPAVQEPRLLVGVIEEIVDATETSIARRFGYAYIDEHGTVEAGRAGAVPRLRRGAADRPRSVAARELPWLAEAEEQAASWIIANQLPAFLSEVKLRRETELHRVREQVAQRLDQENNRLVLEAMVAQEQEQAGKKPRESHTSLMLKAADLDGRRTARLALLDRQLEMQARPPRVVTAALVLPLAAVQAEMPAETRRCTPSRRRTSNAAASSSCSRPSARSAAPRSSRRSTTRLRHPLPARRRGPDPDRGQGPHRRRRGLLRHPQRGAHGAQQRAALPTRARARRPARPRARRGPLPREPVRRLRRRRLRRDRPPRQLGHDVGAGPGAVLNPMTTDARGRCRGEHRSAS